MEESKFKTGIELQRCVLTLSIGDIIGVAKERGMPISDEEAEELFDQFDLSEPLMNSFWEIINSQLEELGWSKDD